jgi:hypothetical protein
MAAATAKRAADATPVFSQAWALVLFSICGQ